MYKLVIAEKPSVAQSIAAVIGANARKEGYLEGNGWLVSWCVGHLVELMMPEDYEEKYGKWKMEDLPIFPENWKYTVSSSTKKQFRILKDLMDRSDVESLVCATDAGREGELIFRLVYEQAGCRKAFLRLWISSMEDQAIRDGFSALRSSEEYDALYQAALCRERADWLIGINATRLFSCLYHQTLNVGRVMTPTLAMVVERDAEIRNFVSEPFYIVNIQADGITAVSQKLKDRADAEMLLGSCRQGDPVTVTSLQRTDRKENPPKLYDLTTLQRDANRILGFTAQQTLDYAQSLYEKKQITYPRTDSRYLTDDMKEKIPVLLEQVAGKARITKVIPVRVESVINSKKVSDHHAIIPTETMVSADTDSLPAGEKAVLNLITARFLSAPGNPCCYTETKLELKKDDAVFTSKIRIVTDPGWKAVEKQILGKAAAPEKEENPEIPAEINLYEGKNLTIQNAEIKEGKTEPKKHFTEDTLLSAMEKAGSDEIPEEAERQGIGTPATRASIIEKLVQKGFIERIGNKKSKLLLATEKGINLVSVVPDQIKSASLTADWEQKLLQVEKKEYGSGQFIQEIQSMVTDLVQDNQNPQNQGLFRKADAKVIGKCPVCGSDVVEKRKGWFCRNPDCRFGLWVDNRFFASIGKSMTADLAEKLLTGDPVHLKKCRSRKTGNSFDADVAMTIGEDGKLSFSLQFEKGKRL